MQHVLKIKRQPSKYNNKPAVLCLTIIGFSVLLVGEVSYIDRLYFFDSVYLNQIIFFLGLYFTSIAIFKLGNSITLLALLMFLIPISITLIWSGDSEYGWFKVGNLYISSYISLICFVFAIRYSSFDQFKKIIIALLLFLLIAAIITKLQTGLFNREKLFFMSGPIVFGRLMGIGVTLTLIGPQTTSRNILLIVFSLAVVWTASKGPILSLLIIWTFYAVFSMSFKQKCYFISIIFASICLLIKNLQFLDTIGLERISTVILFLMQDGISGGNSNSINVRLLAMNEALNIITVHPLSGIGLGGWATHQENFGMLYPHNFFLEVLSEGGLFFGGLFIVPYLIFLLKLNSPFILTPIFLAISQQFSGDILDSRYWLVFAIISYWHHKSYHFARDTSALRTEKGQN